MKSGVLFFIVFVSLTAISASAQSKQVTNADLEKFRQERLKAEADYRANYAKWGFASPEELDRRREQSRIELEKLSTKLREERLERERIDAERQANERRAAQIYRYEQNEVQPQYDSSIYYYSSGRYYRRPIRQQGFQPGYFAGGQFWPTPVVRRMPTPTWIRPR